MLRLREAAGPEELRAVRNVASLVGRRAGACMRSKFAIWSDEGILSKPRATGFARVRLIIVVCSVCGIAAAEVYSQIGPDRGTMATTDRAAGYGTEARVAPAPRAQSSERPSTIDAYVRFGATTGVASSAGAAPQSSTKVALPLAAGPTSTAATTDSTAKPARPRASSESTRTSSDSTAKSESKSDGGDAATATAETNADAGNKASRASSNLDEKRRGTRRMSTRSWTRDDSYAGFESRDARDRNGFMAFGPPDGRGRGYPEFNPRDKRNSFAQFEPWDRRVRNDESRGDRRYPSQSSPFNWFGLPFQ
jgi:hypothetical protein